MAGKRIESRQLAAFDHACRRGGRESLDRNWAKLVRKGLPLVERIPNDRERRLVTFIWRPRGRVTAPSVYTPVANFAKKETELRALGRGGVWYRSFSLSRRTRASYGYSRRSPPDLFAGEKAWTRYLRSVGPDAHNPTHLRFEKDPDDPTDFATTLSVAELPGAPRQPWGRTHGPLRGTEERHRIRSRTLRNVRSIGVHLPAGFAPRKVRYNLLVVFDGGTYRDTVPVPQIVENLTAAGRLSPTVVVLVGNAPHSRAKDMFHNPAFDDFLARELLPWLHRRYRLPTDPSRTVLAGSSLGGLASAHAALHYPRLFGNVLAQSGSFQALRFRGRRASASLMRQFAHAPRLPLRFYLDAGTYEDMAISSSATSLLGSVRHMRDVLEAKGYPVAYAEFEGGHDHACWRGTFADGLIHLLGRSSGAELGGKPSSPGTQRSRMQGLLRA